MAAGQKQRVGKMMYQYFAFAALAAVILLCVWSCYETLRPQAGQGCVKGALAGRAVSLTERLGSLLERFHLPALLVIFAVFLFSRLYMIGLIPAGIHLDELGMAYDAKCLAEFGTDRHGVRYPFYLQAYGGGQSALYAYLASLCIRLFSYSVSVIRLPAVICAIPCFFCAYLLVKEMLGSCRWGLLGPVLVTIIPYFMMSERWALDCNLFLSLATVSFYFYYKALSTGKMKYYVLAGISLGITLYSYVISYLVLPLFLVFTTLYMIYIGKFSWKKTLAMAIPLFLFALPLMLMQLVSMGLCPEFSTVFSDFRALPWYRSGELSLANLPKKIFSIRMLTLGGGWLTYNSLHEYGPLYLFMLPLLLYGFVLCLKDVMTSLRTKTFDISVLIVLFLFFAYFVFMLVEDLNMYKANEIFLPFLLLIAMAIKRVGGGRCGISLSVILLCCMLSYLSFANFYFRFQNSVYGTHPLFTSTQVGDMIGYTERAYNADGSKNLYIQREYTHPLGGDLFAGLYGDVPPAQWVQGGEQQGHIYLNLPEQIDETQDCIYIIGYNWSDIISYLIANGFQSDESFPDYAILYR